MAAPTIPNGMDPLVSDYSYGAPGGVVGTEVAGGSPRVSLDWDRGDQPFTVSMLLDKLRLSVWTIFYHHTIKKGSISFNMRLDSGFGYSTHLVTMVPDSYSVASLNSKLASIRFVVRAESQAYQFDADGAQGFIDLYDLYGDRMDAFLNRIAVFANSDTLVLNFP